jgi:phage repressor protein C with HTH and peptisase S24 domain
MKTIGTRIKARRKELEKTQQALADFCGVSRTAVTQWENGDTENLRGAHLLKAAEFLGVTAIWLETGKEARGVLYRPPPETKPHLLNEVDVPVFAVTASMGVGKPLPDHDTVVGNLQLTNEWVRSNLGNLSSPKNLAVISAYGDSMSPTFNDGDILLVDRGVNDIKIDAVYVFALASELYIKRIQRQMNGGVIIKSDNTLYDPHVVQNSEKEGLRILGRVMWAWNGKKL